MNKWHRSPHNIITIMCYRILSNDCILSALCTFWIINKTPCSRFSLMEKQVLAMSWVLNTVICHFRQESTSKYNYLRNISKQFSFSCKQTIYSTCSRKSLDLFLFEQISFDDIAILFIILFQLILTLDSYKIHDLGSAFLKCTLYGMYPSCWHLWLTFLDPG